MLLATDLPERLWGEAVVTPTYLLNRSPSRVLERRVMPFEAFYGTKPQTGHLRIFGCVAYSRIANAKSNDKMVAREKKLRFVRYNSTRIYRLWESATGQVSKSRDVEFDEETLCQAQQTPAEKRPTESSEVARRLDKIENGADPVDQEGLIGMARRALETIGPDAVPSNTPMAAAVAHTRSKGKKKQTAWPATYKEAKKSPLEKQWKEAMDVQIRAVKEGQTWEEIPKAKVPQGAQILSGRWVYTEKDGDNGKTQKTRWVMRGFEKETNWDDLSAATVKAQTTRILFALVAAED
jgi:hypothetical protein